MAAIARTNTNHTHAQLIGSPDDRYISVRRGKFQRSAHLLSYDSGKREEKLGRRRGHEDEEEDPDIMDSSDVRATTSAVREFRRSRFNVHEFSLWFPLQTSNFPSTWFLFGLYLERPRFPCRVRGPPWSLLNAETVFIRCSWKFQSSGKETKFSREPRGTIRPEP